MTSNQIIVVQICLVLSEKTTIKQYANSNLGSIHTENLLTELFLAPSVMSVSAGGNENMGFVE